MWHIAALVVIGAILSGCATNSGREKAHGAGETASVERAGVKVKVDIYSDRDRQLQKFGEDLGSVGALALEIQIDNNGNIPRLVDPYKVRLRTPDGIFLDPTYGSLVASLLHRPIGREGDFIGAGFGLLGALAVLGAAQSREASLRERTEAYSRGELRKVVLAPGETTRGVLFFALQRGMSKFGEATIVVSLSDPDGSNPEDVAIEVRGITFPSFSKGSVNAD